MSFRKCHVFIFHYGAILEKENKGASQGRMWKRFASSCVEKHLRDICFSIFFPFGWLFFKRPKWPEPQYNTATDHFLFINVQRKI